MQPKLLKKILAGTGIQQAVRTGQISSMVDLLYLQNTTDGHVILHAIPFMANYTWERIGKGYISKPEGRIGIFFDYWGDGHAVPPKQLISDIILCLVEGATLAEVMHSLETGSISVMGKNSPKTLKIDAEAWISKGRVSAVCKIIEPTKVDLKYAFYLLSNGERCALRWYESDPTVLFDHIGKNGECLEVMAFCMDASNNIFSVIVPVRYEEEKSQDRQV